MPLFTTTFCNERAQKTTQLLPSEVGILKSTATNVGCRVEENIGTKGSRMSLEHMDSNNLKVSKPFPSGGIFGAVLLLISYFIDFLPFKEV